MPRFVVGALVRKPKTDKFDITGEIQFSISRAPLESALVSALAVYATEFKPIFPW